MVCRAILNNFERLQFQISRSGHSLMPNISEMAKYTMAKKWLSYYGSLEGE